MTTHYLTRLKKRILEPTELSLGFEQVGTVGGYVFVENKVLSEGVRNSILNRIKLVESKVFDENICYGVRLFEFRLGKSDCGQPLVILDSDSSSNGDVIYLIVRKGRIVTFYFGKSYVPQTTYKLRVDEIVDFSEIK